MMSATVDDAREGSADSTRSRILLVSAQEFERFGYSGASVTHIANKLGLTKGAVYFYFPAKQDIALALVTDSIAHWRALTNAVRAEGLRGQAALARLIDEVPVAYATHPTLRFASTLLRDRVFPPGSFEPPYALWLAMLTELFEEARRCGELDAGLSPEQAAFGLVSLFHGSADLSRSRAGLAAPETNRAGPSIGDHDDSEEALAIPHHLEALARAQELLPRYLRSTRPNEGIPF